MIYFADWQHVYSWKIERENGWKWYFWLVVDLPLRKMMEFVSWDHDIPNWMESHKIHVPNHQPVLFIGIICNSFGNTPDLGMIDHIWFTSSQTDHHCGRIALPCGKQKWQAPPCMFSLERHRSVHLGNLFGGAPWLGGLNCSHLPTPPSLLLPTETCWGVQSTISLMSWLPEFW